MQYNVITNACSYFKGGLTEPPVVHLGYGWVNIWYIMLSKGTPRNDSSRQNRFNIFCNATVICCDIFVIWLSLIHCYFHSQKYGRVSLFCITIEFSWVNFSLHKHYNDVIMRTMTSQITCVQIVYSPVCSGADQRKQQSSAPLAFVRGIHRWPMNSPRKRPFTREILPFEDVIMILQYIVAFWQSTRSRMVPYICKGPDLIITLPRRLFN